jgi:hypothetical protein
MRIKPILPINILLACITLVSCGGGGGGSGSVPSTPTQNASPRFTSATSFTFSENDIVNFTLNVADPDSANITISDDTGGDGALFSVNANSGVVTALTSNGAFNFEAPKDLNGDNVYEQNVTLSDGVNRVTATIRVTITNVDEGPVFTNQSVIPLNENTTGPVITLMATDPEGSDVSNYRIVGVEKLGEVVNSQRLLDAFSIDSVTGVLSVVVPFDAETEGTTVPITVQVEATDGVNNGGGAVSFNLVDLVAQVTSGIRYTGSDSSNQLGAYTESVGDIDQDGLEDFWITASVDSAGLETAWLVWGKTVRDEMSDGFGDMRIDTLSSSQAIRFSNDNRAQTQRLSTMTARNAGDVDGDGVPDLLIAFVEERDANSVTDTPDGPIAAVIWGNRLREVTSGTMNVADLAIENGQKLTGLSRWENIQLSIGAGDFDGDGRSDIVLGTPLKNQARVIYGSALSKGSASLNVGTATANAALLIQSISTQGSVIQQIGFHVSSIDDLNGDGFEELVISGAGLEPQLESGVYVIASQVIANAKGSTALIDLLDPAITNNVVEMIGLYTSIIGLTALGDLDGDGLNELVLAHEGNNGSKQVATMVYGITLSNALAARTDPSLVLTSVNDGLMVFIEDQIFSQTVGARICARTIPSFTGGAGDELLIGLAGDSPLGRNEAGSFIVLQDTAITALNSATLSFSITNVPVSIGRKLAGFTAGAQLGGVVFAADLDGDELTDLSMASIKSAPTGINQSLGAYFMLPGTELVNAFNEANASFDMATALSDESP